MLSLKSENLGNAPTFGHWVQLSSPEPLPPIEHLLQEVSRQSLVVVRGLPPLTREALLTYCGKASPGLDAFLHWEFGPVMELKPDAEAKNYLFSRERVPFHWDGAFHKVPRTLVFNCVEAPSENGGGETLFSDGEKIFHSLTSEEKSRWEKVELIYRTRKVAHYGGEFRTPLFERHPVHQRWRIRFAEPVETELNPVELEIRGVSSSEAANLTARLTQALHDPKFCYAHTWRTGDLLLADNLMLLHGRNPFTQNTRRHMRRLQLL